VGSLDVIGFCVVDALVLAGVIADVPPDRQAHENREGAGDDEGHPPAARGGDQPGDEDAAQASAQGSSGVEDGGAAATFLLVHPDGVELAAGRHDARLRHANAKPGDEHAEESAGET